MNNVLFTIDSYLSTEDRSINCKNLILQIRKNYPEKKILLINKFSKSWGLESIVDHYYFFGDGFLVGYPPTDILNSEKYERPYTYVSIDCGICENWYPLINVTDHVGNVFNSFIISCNIAKMLNYDKIFKIEYDTILDDNEFLSISNDIESFQDYLVYGKRKEGDWAKQEHSLVDVHMIGYSIKCFDNYQILKNDDDFWNLCEKIGYYGKWIEYLISILIDIEKNTKHLNGIEYSEKIRNKFFKSKFDNISSSSEWEKSWKNVPKICKMTKTENVIEKDIEKNIILFYWNNSETVDSIESECIIQDEKSGNEIYRKNITLLSKRNWMFDSIFVDNPIKITTITKYPNENYIEEQIITPENIKQLNARFIFK
jgi:hypothetical protein